MIYFSDFDVPVPSGPPVPLGALVYETSSDGNNPRNFDAEAYDDSSWFGAPPSTSLVVPSGVSLVRVVGQRTATGADTLANRRNGSEQLGLGKHSMQDGWASAVSAPIAVSVGDAFTQYGNGGTPDITGGMWFGIETLDAATQYALVSKTAGQAIAGSTPTAITWDNEIVDSGGWHDNSTNNTRMTVPSGVSRVRVTFAVEATAQVDKRAYVTKNGATVVGCPYTCTNFGRTSNGGSAILDVVPGDYFEVVVNGSAHTVGNLTGTWFAIEEAPDYARCLVRKVATQAVTSGVTVALAFGTGSETYDTVNIHDESSNDSRLTVPSGYTRARLCFNVVPANATGAQRAWVRKNGSGTVPLIGLPGAALNETGVDQLTGFGAWIDVSVGDYFELMFTPGANQTLPVDVQTYFGIELA